MHKKLLELTVKVHRILFVTNYPHMKEFSVYKPLLSGSGNLPFLYMENFQEVPYS